MQVHIHICFKIIEKQWKNKTLGGNFVGTLYIIAAKCPAGQFPVNNTNCALCPVGYYKATVDNVACTPCNSNQTTNSTGSTDSSQCGQYETSSMPYTQLWLWSAWYDVPCMPGSNAHLLLWSAWGFSYVRYTALIGVSIVFPVLGHMVFHVWGQRGVPCLVSAFCAPYAPYTELLMINLMSPVCLKPVLLPLLVCAMSLVCRGSHIMLVHIHSNSFLSILFRD